MDDGTVFEVALRFQLFVGGNMSGLISAAPGRRNHSLQNSSKQVEGMVRAKMEQKEYIILCLEDTNDWSNATTRRLVMQVPILALNLSANMTLCVSLVLNNFKALG